jgi:hypothetical protein
MHLNVAQKKQHINDESVHATECYSKDIDYESQVYLH